MSCGTRARDFRPGDPDGASTPSSIPRLRTAVLLCRFCVLPVTRTTRWPAKAPTLQRPAPITRPACHVGLEPHRRTSRCARPQPTPSPRYRSPTPLPDTANRSVARDSANSSAAGPDHPSCDCFGLEPHRRTARCARPQSTPSPRCCSFIPLRVLRPALAGTATASTAVYRSRRPLITAGHPVRPSVPSPSCDNPGFGTPPAHRPANCDFVYCARQFVSARACCLSGLREKP